MKTKWLIMGLYVLVNSLSLLLFWLAAQVKSESVITIGIGDIALAVLLPGGIVYFFASHFEERIDRIYYGIRGIIKGEYQPTNLPEYTFELGKLSREITNLGQQVKLSMLTNKQESKKNQAILAGMQEGLISLDLVGHVVLVNRAAERIFDRTEEEIRDKHFRDLSGLENLEELITEALEKGTSGQMELMINAKLIIRAQVSPINREKTRSQGVIIVCHDITEIRRLEQLRTEFVGNVSHELRTPLTSIKGFVETLIDGAAEVPQLRERFLNIIHKETLRLQRLVDELLTLSRIENQRPDTDLSMSKVQEAYERVRPVLEPYADAKKIDLEVKIPKNLPEVAMGIDLLSQVLLNLMENAVKYTVEGRVWLHAFHNDQSIHLEIGDTGSGIPHGDLPRIFERFYRVDKARSREQGGTGLGLSIVKHIVEGAKGKITVASELGAGSVFICELPVGNGEKKSEEKGEEGHQ